MITPVPGERPAVVWERASPVGHAARIACRACLPGLPAAAAGPSPWAMQAPLHAGPGTPDGRVRSRNRL